jgi:tetratricopeptide (TPR) repeat protein
MQAPDESRSGTWRRARWLLPALLGLILAPAVVERLRLMSLTPAQRAHEHCVRAAEIAGRATTRPGVRMNNLPREVEDEMLEEYLRALEIDPTHIDALQQRIRLRPSSSDHDRLIELEPTNARLWIERAKFRVGTDDEGAIADYSRAIELDPRASRFGRADCHLRRGDFAAALADYQTDGGEPYGIASCLAGLGRHAEALPYFDAYMAAHPDLADLHYERGVSRFAAGDAAGAHEDFERAVRSEWTLKRAHERIAAHPGEPLTKALIEALGLERDD